MRTRKVYVAGHRGMVGSAILRALRAAGYQNIVARDRSELDLTDQRSVRRFFAEEKPEVVFLAAAKVGGIHANHTYAADFVYQNLMIEANVVNESWRSGVARLLFLGSSCIYPRLAKQPMPEHSLLTGTLEPTNEPYAIAKIAGIKLCESYNRQYGTDYRCLMPTNLYGPNDNYHPENSHVIPALVRRFHDAKLAKSAKVVIWGTGTPKREFLFVDDLAAACIQVMELEKSVYSGITAEMVSHINVGSGNDISIAELASMIGKVVGFQGSIHFDSTKPDGAPRKLLDVSRLFSLGWRPRVELEQGLRATYEDYLARHARH
jgi:GDP-L-fucose synthase